ncbi:aminotransferase class I/II-fold pyridoxal phosphate-dependent enzyme [Aurantimonas sp. VKM B-3413]|uniref:aminotransferase class I/II-fold pyridoxal phosphate-dependent enzyme n=1 Tax=Aurantimonas sp. VKM B-3413 TaxID=2779401 RepID=UPI001E2EAA94|nr:aminotransferase class I/II-fold pyridoxal phosphate-dependent enzyme [Aurantimonas sp. VKM B-3413]MCB8836228.1 aminotransferase class I/II-fold pyridoxal phosphate-dependent enzyme [Aurantimonas sp. VKM B-3413]
MKRLAIDPDTALAHVRGAIADVETDNIALMAEKAGSIGDVIRLWYGESDVVTPEPIRRAAKESLDRGETFYVPQMAGHPALAAELATYQSELHGLSLGIDRSTVTPGGMQAVHLALSLMLEPGANAVYVEPQWPNIRHSIHLTGAEARPVALDLVDGRWSLDLDRLFDACDARTRAIVFSTPSNPCGWCASHDELEALVDFSRRTGIWIVSDEMYSRLARTGRAAPSLLQHAGDEDLALCINGFSKAWAMTGWRVGWLNHPASVAPAFRAVTQYVNSGTSPFVQAGALAALQHGEEYALAMRDRCMAGLDAVYERLGRSNSIRLPEMPEGGMYAFFPLAPEGEDARQACLDLVSKARVGLAPGGMFGKSTINCVRMCVARDPEVVAEACDRLLAAL